MFGRKRYLTGDHSRNNWWLAIITLGEGWHNNHHHFQSAACQGFRWYEIDISYYVLKALAALGIVWDLRKPPAAAVRNEQRVPRAIVEQAAGELAASFQVDRIADELRAAFAKEREQLDASIEKLHDDFMVKLDEWRHQLDEKMESVRQEFDELTENVHLPAMPTLDQLSERANDMFVRNPSLNDIAERARLILIESLCLELLEPNKASVKTAGR